MKTKFLITLAALSMTSATISPLYGQNSKFCNPLPPNLSQHLVAYYPFCGNANDISGNNNNPSYVNATLVNDRFGNPNSAYGFKRRSHQYIKGNCSNYPVNQRTVSVWFKVNDSTLNNEILGYGGGQCGSSFFFCINDANRLLTYNVSGHCGVNDCTTGQTVVPDHTWSNFIVVTGKKNTKFYLNGVLMQTFTGITFKNTSVTGKDFAFGSIPGGDGYAPYHDGNVNFLNGYLDDIVIYDSAFDDAGVLQLYQYFKTETAASSSSTYNQSGLKLPDVSSASLFAWPNPSNGVVTVNYFSGREGKASLRVNDVRGNIVFTNTNKAISAGNNSIQLNLSHLDPGTYFLELVNGVEVKRIKLLIRR